MKIYPNRVNNLRIKGEWNMIKDNLKQRGARLTDDDYKLIDGKDMNYWVGFSKPPASL